MKFTKMHGLGNDYIYVYTNNEGDLNYSDLAIKLSDRHFGIGGDGIITISDSETCDYFMQIYNADGSKGEMCGNGIRCVGKYVYDKGLTDKTHLEIDTLAGIKYLDLNVVDGKVSTVKVDMGIPTLHNGNDLNISDSTHAINVNGEDYEVMDVSMGNPHTVIFVPEITDYLVHEVGKIIENDPYYPNRTNVEFVVVENEDTLRMRVWERGSGETMACGTGSCATAVAYMLKYGVDKEITVKLLGGVLKISLNNGRVIMEGSATTVFEGEVNI